MTLLPGTSVSSVRADTWWLVLCWDPCTSQHYANDTEMSSPAWTLSSGDPRELRKHSSRLRCHLSGFEVILCPGATIYMEFRHKKVVTGTTACVQLLPPDRPRASANMLPGAQGCFWCGALHAVPEGWEQALFGGNLLGAQNCHTQLACISSSHPCTNLRAQPAYSHFTRRRAGRVTCLGPQAAQGRNELDSSCCGSVG